MTALKDKEPSVRWIAASCLGSCGEAGKKAMPDLVKLAKNDDNPNVRSYAIGALSRMGDDALPVLLDLLKEKDVTVQRSAMTGLQQYQAKAKDAVPTLIEFLKSTDI